ncbi:MAG: hypothetical protein NC237_12650, partial [Eubacterium sp.]|nr:hypothetical protein [Eubacterium sp.]
MIKTESFAGLSVFIFLFVLGRRKERRAFGSLPGLTSLPNCGIIGSVVKPVRGFRRLSIGFSRFGGD